MNNLNKVKNNNVFYLVELIFVIVILVLLIGVTIGSIYRYDNQSRVTTDIDNASSIQSIIAPVATDANVNKALGDGEKVTIIWSDSTVARDKIKACVDFTNEKAKDAVVHSVKALMPDSLPASKSKGSFKIEVKKDNGNITATCTAYSDTNASDGKELKW